MSLKERATVRMASGETVQLESNIAKARASVGMSIATKGIVFPYTPNVIQTDFQAQYGEHNITHSVYQPQYWINSPNNQISVQATFTCQDKKEFVETATAQAFFRGVTKGSFGELAGKEAGLPPPILKLNIPGSNNMIDVPCVLRSFTLVLDDQVDYVEWFNMRLPTRMIFSMVFVPQYAPTKVRKTFSIDRYRKGDYNNPMGGWM